MKIWMLLGTLLFSPLANANSADGAIEIKDAWVRSMPEGIPNTAAFFEINNTLPKTVTLVGVSTPIAKQSEIHETIQQGPFTTMNEVKKVTIPAKESVGLKPGGLHVMLVGLEKPLEEGQTIPLTLTFQDGTKVKVDAKIKNP